MRRAAAAAASLTCVVAGLCGCGSQTDAYCGALRAAQPQLASIFGAPDPAVALMSRGIPTLQHLADEAPDGVAVQWQSLLNAVLGLRDALRAAGLDPKAFNGRLPASLPAQRRADIVAAATELGSARVAGASNDIETHAQDMCRVRLGR